MASCDITIELDEPDRVFEPGDTIRGRVLVDVDDAVRCDGLTVEHKWQTHGRGNTDRRAVGAVTLFEGEWSEAGRFEYDFEFEQPPGPQTYRGHYLNVDWYVSAEADVPWALDPEAKVDHLARYRGAALDYEPGSPSVTESAGDEVRGCEGCVAALGVALLIMGLFPLSVFAFDGDVEGLIGGGIMLLMGGVLAGLGLWSVLARKKLGDVEVVAEPGHVLAGETVTCSVTVTPPRAVELNEIRCTLSATEVVTRGSGTDSRTYRHEVHEHIEATGWPEARTLSGGQSHTFEQTFVIPEDAAPSFDSGDDNKMEWSIETHVDIPTWPDFKTRNVVIVVPRHPDLELSAADRSAEDTDEPQNWW